MDASRELLRAERLRDVVVGACVEPLLDVGFACARRQQDDGNVGGLGVGADRAQHLEAGGLRHHPVEHGEVGMPLAREPQRLFAVAGDDDLVAGARKAQLDEREDVLVVVGDEQHGHAVGDRVGEQK